MPPVTERPLMRDVVITDADPRAVDYLRNEYERYADHGMDMLTRDLDRPDRFVWLRGFTDMAARHEALTEFYTGAVWAEHGPAANATMVDWDDVRLLEPIRLPTLAERGPETRASTPYWISVHESGTALGPDAPGLLRTLRADNTFPILPVREDGDVVVRLSDAPPAEPALQVIRAESTSRSLLP